ncbi:hypothetical protein DPMN_116554 [Dreissena polymorpha]|uniref:Uncharacterized protein n=1 Tax=Dreissena polymorpha TaxID=45954 RepID=A0A9D4QUE0_DREPO|nr:hypothetical protein DPMN_116554 [Dreissena polymorpha]
MKSAQALPKYGSGRTDGKTDGQRQNNIPPPMAVDNKSDVGRSPGNTRALIVRSCSDLNSIPSRARRRVNFLVRLKINPEAARCYKLARFLCDHRPVASPMNGKIRQPLIRR